MNKLLGATPSRLFNIPRLALMTAKGIINFSIRRTPCEKGLKIGIRRYTLSRENEETDATFPVEKKADWRRKRKKSEIRASERVSGLYGEASWASVVFEAVSIGDWSCFEMSSAASERLFVAMVGDGGGKDDESLE